MNADAALDVVRREALWFEPTSDGLRPLVEAIGDARLVLIGEATHGTHEFYRARAELTNADLCARAAGALGLSAGIGRMLARAYT